MSDRERSRSRSRSPARNDDNKGDNKGDDAKRETGGAEEAEGIKLYVGNLDYGKSLLSGWMMAPSLCRA
jgi:hypothetical protein